MWAASVRRKCKRINKHVVHCTAPAPLKASELFGQTGRPSSGQAIHDLQQLPL